MVEIEGQWKSSVRGLMRMGVTLLKYIILSHDILKYICDNLNMHCDNLSQCIFKLSQIYFNMACDNTRKYKHLGPEV